MSIKQDALKMTFSNQTNSHLPQFKNKEAGKLPPSPVLFNNAPPKPLHSAAPFKLEEYLSCEPRIIEFLDYEPSKIYSKQLSVINKSKGSISFHFENFEENRYDVFNLQFQSSGKLAAGLSVPFQLSFFPNNREDFETYLNVKTPKGSGRIQIKCRFKKSIVEIKERNVDFQDTILGECTTKYLDIFNRGGKETKVFIKDANGQFLANNVDCFRSFFDNQNKGDSLVVNIPISSVKLNCARNLIKSIISCLLFHYFKRI